VPKVGAHLLCFSRASLAPFPAIAGAADTIVSTDIHSRAIIRQVSAGRLVTLPGVGHMPHHIVPDLIARESLALSGARP
jgi:pimeloyl-ACP methyl ester carboxylesterase